MLDEMVFDLNDLDAMLDAGVKPETLVGLRADWHGEIVPIVRYGEEFALKVVLKCARKGCRHQTTVMAVSGCHSGAYCYVYDRHGHFADLRNQEFVCEQHQRAPRGRWDRDGKWVVEV